MGQKIAHWQHLHKDWLLFNWIWFKYWKIVYENVVTVVLISVFDNDIYIYILIFLFTLFREFMNAAIKHYFQIYNTDKWLVCRAERNKWPAPSLCISSAVTLNICILYTHAACKNYCHETFSLFFVENAYGLNCVFFFFLEENGYGY